LNLVSSAAPPAIVHELRAEELALVTATGAHFVRLARERQAQIRALGRDRATAKAVEDLRHEERDDVEARLDLERLTAATPPLRARIRTGAAAPASQLVSWYREAQRRFGIRWQLLAAINFVESDFDRIRNTSVAAAQGPMQFQPATWRAYGLGGDVRDPHDAILGAANLLAANHGRTDERTALYHYNPSHLYIDAVEHYAHRIQTVRFAFREYYAWKLFIKRKGPGA
jgi:membrane-bound lytic murein transglycosylase B